VRLAGHAGLIIGVDTHLDTHTAAICDARGREVSQLQVPATSAGLCGAAVVGQVCGRGTVRPCGRDAALRARPGPSPGQPG
jgi:hypothetical protein